MYAVHSRAMNGVVMDAIKASLITMLMVIGGLLLVAQLIHQLLGTFKIPL